MCCIIKIAVSGEDKEENFVKVEHSENMPYLIMLFPFNAFLVKEILEAHTFAFQVFSINHCTKPSFKSFLLYRLLVLSLTFQSVGDDELHAFAEMADEADVAVPLTPFENARFYIEMTKN